MEKRVVLVTGASSGIGEATVVDLLSAGHIVYAAARRVERMSDLEQRGARLLRLDVTDDASMTGAVQQILDEQGRIDVLVNNAGYGSYGALEDVPIDEARRQFEVNVFGLARLTQLALPSMRARRSGLVVNVSSIGGRIYEPLGSWYHATKFAVEGLSDSLRVELQPHGVDVVVIRPGAIRTEWSAISRTSAQEVSGRTAYGPQARALVRTLEAADGNRLGARPEVIAATIAKAVEARRPRTRYTAPASAKLILFFRWILPDRAFDAVVRRAFGPRRSDAAPRT